MILRDKNSYFFSFQSFQNFRFLWLMFFFVSSFLLCGCQTTLPVQPVHSPKETRKDVQEALSSVAQALSGKLLNEEDLRNLQKQIRTDEDAQTAIRAITESVEGKVTVVKYCPVTGRRYAPHLTICPEHHVELEIVDP